MVACRGRPAAASLGDLFTYMVSTMRVKRSPKSARWGPASRRRPLVRQAPTRIERRALVLSRRHHSLPAAAGIATGLLKWPACAAGAAGAQPALHEALFGWIARKLQRRFEMLVCTAMQAALKLQLTERHRVERIGAQPLASLDGVDCRESLLGTCMLRDGNRPVESNDRRRPQLK